MMTMEYAARYETTCFPLRAFAERLPASRPCALGADRFRDGAALGGRFLLRMEDIDPTRCRPEFETAICEDLEWLGIAWEEPVRRQSEHLGAYRDALAKLEAQGLVYPSFESRGEIARLVAEREAEAVWPRDPDGDAALSGRGEDAVAGKARAADRLRRPIRAAPRHECSPRTHRRADLGRNRRKPEGRPRDPDGAAGGVGRRRARAQGNADELSPVGRGRRRAAGRDPRGAWPGPLSGDRVHRVLQALLELPPPLYHHHRLVVDAEGRKLAKSTRATALRELRRQGLTPADIRRIVGLA